MYQLKVYKKNPSQFGEEYLYSFSKDFKSLETLKNWVLNYLDVCDIYEEEILQEFDFRNYAIFENELFDINNFYNN